MIIKKAATLFIISVSMIIGVSLILLITETIPPNHGIEYIFVEVFSCFATVGLTMGLTPHLTLIGKVLLIDLCLWAVSDYSLSSSPSRIVTNVMISIIQKDIFLLDSINSSTKKLELKNNSLTFYLPA